MRYLWLHSVEMNNDRLLTVLGSESHTPWDDAVEATLNGLGCLQTSSDNALAAR